MKKISLIGMLFFFCLAVTAFATENNYDQSLQKGFALSKEGKFADARKMFETCTDESYALSEYSGFGIAESYFNEKDYLKALQNYQLVMNKYPKSALIPFTLLQSGKCYMNLKNFAKAESIFNKIIGNDDLSAAVKEASFLLNETEKTIEEAAPPAKKKKVKVPVEKTVVLNPADSSDNLELLYKDALKKRYTSKNRKYYRGFIEAVNFWANKDYRSASDAFKTMYSRYPGMLLGKYSYLMYGRSELRRSKTKEAINIFEGCGKFGTPIAPEAAYYLSFAYAYAGEEEESLQSLKTVVEVYPHSTYAEQAAFDLAKRYEKKLDFDSAISIYKRFLAKYPGSPIVDDAAANLGFLYYRIGSMESAYESLKSSYEKYKNYESGEQLTYWLAKAAEVTDHKDQAVDCYQRIIRNNRYSYYAFRAGLQLKKYGESIERAQTKPSVDLSIFKIKEKESDEEMSPILDLWGALLKKADYSGQVSEEDLKQNPVYQRYSALFSLGLYRFAAIEAADLARNDKILYPLGKVLFAIGEFRGPTLLADNYLSTATEKGKLDSVPQDLWPLAYPLAYWKEVDFYSKLHGTDPYFVLSVMREESRFGSSAVSRSSARGLMQIMPKTGKGLARMLGFRDYATPKLFDPQVNISMGAYYLSDLLNRFYGIEYYALAAYNGGPSRVSKWIDELGGATDLDVDVFVESIPLRETRNYVKKVMRSYQQYKRIYGSR
ncbi:MAG: transglycosylase SLT domain-containing protein [Candidatus Saganbacteria bacterium]|nr:transglycosylase SLT domain-containing protein [Candidatus Saganbacteria bacterium]